MNALAVLDHYLGCVLPGKLWDGRNPYCNMPGREGSEYANDMRALAQARAGIAELIERAAKILAAHDSGNNGAIMGEATLSQHHAELLRAALARVQA